MGEKNYLFEGTYCTGLQNKILTINFQYSVSFSPVEYGYESHFFPSRPVFQKIYDKDL